MMSVSQDRTVHEAAHILRNGVTPRPNGGNYAHIPYPEDEDQLTYTTSDLQVGSQSIQMSDHADFCSSLRRPFSRRRRLFCLLTVFDFSMLVMLWFIYSQFLGLKNYGFVCQVLQYSFESSMFDLALLASWRVIFLLLVYGLIRSEKWYAVAFTTITTSVMVICKTFFYDFTGQKGSGSSCYTGLADARFADVIILIANFVIVWFELFILDFQVIKRERRLHAAQLHRENNGTSERSPLLSSLPSSSPTQSDHSHRRKRRQQFYSPFDSPAESDQEFDEDQHSSKESLRSEGAFSAANFESLPNSQKGSNINLAASLQEQKFLQKSEDAFTTFQELIEADHSWTVVKTVEAATISILAHDIALSSILFKLEASLPVSAERLFTIMWDQFESAVSWNPTVEEAEVVQYFGTDLQVVYMVTKSILVSSRDFVSIRQHSVIGETHLVSDVSVEHPDKPVVKDYVRGEQGVSGWVVEPENVNRCRLCWIVNTDIKMKLCPQSLYRQAFSNSLVEIYQGLTKLIGAEEEGGEETGAVSSLNGS